MKNFDLNELNTEQRLALADTEGPVLVTAGAGSGKTRLLTYRIAHLIRDKQVSPYNILAVTFTNKAAKEMKERLSDMVDESDKMLITTFHTLCCNILRRNIVAFQNKVNLKRETEYRKGFDSNFSIYSDDDKEKIVKEYFSQNNIAEEKEGLSVKNAKWHISNAKNKGLTPFEYQKEFHDIEDIEIYTHIYNWYQIELENNNALDFDDLLVKTYELFKLCPEILNYYQNKFQYIHVDEFQDTNTIQYKIIKMIADKYKNIFIVGDEDQCIYGWRGANISNILDFKNDFPACKTFKLEQNYRSTKNILNSANALIKNNSLRNPKSLWTDNIAGVKVEQNTFYSDYEEAEHIASVIKELVNNYSYKYNEIAILVRLNSLMKIFEDKLREYKIPYNVFGNIKFNERKEIKEVLSYLRLLVNPQDSAALLRIINFPRRGIGDVALDELKKQSKYYNVDLMTLILNEDEEFFLSDKVAHKFDSFKELYLDLKNALTKLPLVDFIVYMIKTIGFEEAYGSKNEIDEERLKNINEIIIDIEKLCEQKSTATLDDYLQQVSLSSDIDKHNNLDGQITLSTIHLVKGLEFKTVFIPALEEKIFPHMYPGSNLIKNIEEERRLMYVAITRARERLYLTNARTRVIYGQKMDMSSSRFITEAEIAINKTYNFGKATYDSSNNAYTKNNYNFAGYESSKVSFSMPTSSSAATQKSSALSTFKVGIQVLHTKFGIGTIKSIDDASKLATVEFKDFGVKTLSLEYAPIKAIKGE